jgi:hypothetical protein
MMQTWTIFSIIQVRVALFLFGNIHEGILYICLEHYDFMNLDSA